MWLHSGGDCGRLCGERTVVGATCIVVVIVEGDVVKVVSAFIVVVIVGGDCDRWCIVVVIVGGDVANAVGGAWWW